MKKQRSPYDIRRLTRNSLKEIRSFIPHGKLEEFEYCAKEKGMSLTQWALWSLWQEINRDRRSRGYHGLRSPSMYLRNSTGISRGR